MLLLINFSIEEKIHQGDKMADTKKKIIEQAKTLFSQKGYRNVSLREIAEAADTTIGNLTYHFPQKEDLILSIQENMFEDYLNEYINQNSLYDSIAILQKLIQSFYQAKQNRDTNSLFYRNIIELSQQSPITAKHIEDFRLKTYEYYYSSFMQLRQQNIMRSDIEEPQYQILAFIIVSMSYLWTQDTTPYYDKNLPRIEIDYGLKNLIYPYLTIEGISIYTMLMQNDVD